MEALVPAFLLALLSHYGDRPALLTAMLAERFRRPLLVAIMAGIAHAAGNAIAALLGMTLAPLLNPHAQMLMLAIALAFGGIGGMLPLKPPGRSDYWALGPVLTPLLAVFVLSAGDRAQFFTVALGLGGAPWLAAAGSALGAFAAGLVAIALGAQGWRAAANLRGVRLAISGAMLVAGAVVGLRALRLL